MSHKGMKRLAVLLWVCPEAGEGRVPMDRFLRGYSVVSRPPRDLMTGVAV